MIGRGAAGNAGPMPSRATHTTLEDGWAAFRDRAEALFRPVWRFVQRVTQVARWVLERVAVLERVEWFRWDTMHDERTCPECGPLDGRTWPESVAIPSPPLHVNCRCRLVHDHTEWRVRQVETWQREWRPQVSWTWQRTGWA